MSTINRGEQRRVNKVLPLALLAALILILILTPVLEGFFFIISGKASKAVNGIFNIDMSTPEYSSIGQSANSIAQGGQVILSAFWLDNVRVDYAWISTNETGVWENKGIIHIGSPSGWSNFTWNNPGFYGTTYWRTYANDTAGNTNSTPIISFYVSQKISTPPEIAGGGGGGGGGPPAVTNQTNGSQTLGNKFIEAPRSIYVELYQGEAKRVSVYILNTLNSSQTFSGYLTSDLEDIMFFKVIPSLYLRPGDRGELSLQVQVPENMEPGNYSGELNVSAGQLMDRIPIIIRVLEAKKGLLDLRIKPLQPIISPGGMENVNVSLYNLGQTGRINVRLVLKLIDSNNTVVSEEEESVSVDTSLSSVVAIKVPEWTSEGGYTIKAIAYYKGPNNESMQVYASEKIDVVKAFDAGKFLETPVFGMPLWQILIGLAAAAAVAGFNLHRRRRFGKKAKAYKKEGIEFARKMESGAGHVKPEEEKAATREMLKKEISVISDSLSSMKERGMETTALEKKLSGITWGLESGDSASAQKKARVLRKDAEKEKEKFEKEVAKKQRETADKARKERARIQKEIERLDKEQAKRDREALERAQKEREKFEKEVAKKEREELEKARKDERKEDEEEIIEKAGKAREKFEKEQEQKRREALEKAIKKKEELEKSRAGWEREVTKRVRMEKAAEALRKKEAAEITIAGLQKKIDEEYAKLESGQVRKQAVTTVEHKERPEPAREKPENKSETTKTTLELIKRKLAEETIPLKAKGSAKPEEEEELKIEYEEPQKLFSFKISGKQKEKIQQQKADMKIPEVPPAWMREGLESLKKDIERSEFRVSLLEERGIDDHKINRELDVVKRALHRGTHISEKDLNSARAMSAEISKGIDALENEAKERPVPGKMKQHPENLPPAETVSASAEEIEALTRDVKALREEFELLQERIDIIPLEVEFTQIENALHFRKDMTRDEMKQMARQVSKIKNGVERIKISIAYNWLQKELASLEEELKTLRGKGAETGQHEKEISEIRVLLRRELTLKDTTRLKKMVVDVKAGMEKKKAKKLKRPEK